MAYLESLEFDEPEYNDDQDYDDPLITKLEHALESGEEASVESVEI